VTAIDFFCYFIGAVVGVFIVLSCVLLSQATRRDD
jgi:hypothetical protein